MKKLFFIAAIASAALVSCIKNELAPSVTEQHEIAFAAPVVGLHTKAAEIEGTTYPNTVNFNVWAWYHENVFNGTGNVYMNEVTVKYSAEDPDAGDSGENTWRPEKAYYWPKNGKLTFEAYSPSNLETKVTGCSVTSTVDGGLVVADYDVPADAANQIDLLYSDRNYNRVASSTNKDGGYDGVDIAFNHALAVVKVFVKAENDAAIKDVRVKDVHIINAYHKGTLTVSPDYLTATNSPLWNPIDDRTTYDVVSATDYTTSITLTSTSVYQQLGVNHILLPQVFTTSGTKIKIDYYINNGGEFPIEQTYTFDLASTDHKDDASNQIKSWEMGKRYTYNITIGVDDIYFAPSVKDWDDVTITVPEI